jgi:hypothetical protein
MVTLCELIKYTQLGTTSAENLIKLHFIRIRRCDEMYLPLSLKFCAAQLECFGRSRNKFFHFAHTKKFESRQPPLFRFAERQSKRLQPNLGGGPKGPCATCINLYLHDNERRWKWKRSKLLGTTQLRKTSNSTANAFVTVIRFVLSSVVQHLLNEEQIPFSFVFFGFYLRR